MILITGMHRSGTSLVAMTLEALGVSFGDHSAFYAADQWNANGYFERRDVMDINSRMITGFERTASRVAALAGQMRYLAQPRLDRVLARGSSFGDEMRLVKDETTDGAIKDPRLSLTWSAWADVISVDSCVVCIRHPFEVADSLRRRQGIPLKLGLRFWRYHMSALQKRTPPRLVVVDLESLIERPSAELDMLIDELDLTISREQAVGRFHSVYTPGMAKRRSSESISELDAETAELWDWLTSSRTSPSLGRPE